MAQSIDGILIYSHGSKMLGTFWRADTTGKHPTVLLLHGIPGVEKNTDLAYALREAGWNCIALHYRGCWGSEGNYNLAGNIDDIIAAIDFAASDPGVDMGRFAIVGLSLGGYGVIAAAARDPRPKAIVSINPLVTPADQPLDDATFTEWAAMLAGITAAEAKAQWLALTPLPELAPQLTGFVGRPTLLLTGEADPYFPPSHAKPLADAMPFAEWKRILGADHMFCDHRATLVHTVINWLTLNAFPSFPLFPSSPGLLLRHSLESDHARVLAVLNDWWGGRDLSHLLPRLYFQHFNDTSFIIEQDGELVAFLIGFISQSEPDEAYIHFVGVHPDHRKDGLARSMYERFFALARARGAREVHCITSPVNTVSIAFHKRLGFEVSEPIANYDGLDGDRVSMKRIL